jgi:hypothetical protein
MKHDPWNELKLRAQHFSRAVEEWAYPIDCVIRAIWLKMSRASH